MVVLQYLALRAYLYALELFAHAAVRPIKAVHDHYRRLG